MGGADWEGSEVNEGTACERRGGWLVTKEAEPMLDFRKEGYSETWKHSLGSTNSPNKYEKGQVNVCVCV